MKNEKFYEKTWFSILMLIFICPVGVFLIWRNKKINRILNILISVIAIPYTIIGLVFWYGMFNQDAMIERSQQDSIERRNKAIEEKKTSDNVEDSKVDEQIDEEIKVEDTKVKSDKEPKDIDTITPFLSACKSAEEVSFDKLKRNPDSYSGKNILVKGIINQVLEGDNETPSNLKVYDEITEEEIMLIYDRKEGQERYLEGDYIWTIAQFDSVQGITMLNGSSQAFPVAEIKQIYLGEIADAMKNVYEATDNMNYKIIYLHQSFSIIYP